MARGRYSGIPTYLTVVLCLCDNIHLDSKSLNLYCSSVFFPISAKVKPNIFKK